MQLTTRQTKSLRALYNAAESRVPIFREEVQRGLNELERIAYPERFERDSVGRLRRKK